MDFCEESVGTYFRPEKWHLWGMFLTWKSTFVRNFFDLKIYIYEELFWSKNRLLGGVGGTSFRPENRLLWGKFWPENLHLWGVGGTSFRPVNRFCEENFLAWKFTFMRSWWYHENRLLWGKFFGLKIYICEELVVPVFGLKIDFCEENFLAWKFTFVRSWGYQFSAWKSTFFYIYLYYFI